MTRVKTLLIDNYDSFTYNLYQLISVVNGTPPVVVYNDAFGDDWAKLCAAFPDIDNVVISPGPGTPENPADFGISASALTHSTKPVLGVCLGCQGLGFVFGAKIKQAPEIVHGRCTLVEFSAECKLFHGIGRFASAARYHSLCIDPKSLPECLSVTAWTTSPSFTVMGIEHRHKPFFGVQFHPESVGTPCGKQILLNFRDFTQHWRRATCSGPAPELDDKPEELPKPLTRTSRIVGAAENLPRVSWEVNIAEIFASAANGTNAREVMQSFPPLNSYQLFERLFSNSPACFWLDSSSSDPSLAATGPVKPQPMSRFSFMGDDQGPCAFALESWSDNSTLQLFRCPQGCRCSDPHKLHTRELSIDPFDAIRADGALPGNQESLHFRHWRATVTPGEIECQSPQLEPVNDAAATALPFDFLGGFVGYFAYELRHRAFARLGATQGNMVSPTALVASDTGSPPRHPLSLWMFADRFVAIDNHTGQCFVVWLTPWVQGLGRSNMAGVNAGVEVSQYEACEPLVCSLHSRGLTKALRKSIEKAQEEWALATLKELAACLDKIPGQTLEVSAPTRGRVSQPDRTPGQESDWVPHFRSALTENEYKASINVILEEIRKGNAYEVCLTDQMTATYDPVLLPPISLYSQLRDKNRSNFGAFLKYDRKGCLTTDALGIHSNEPAASRAALALCCSSPELFLKVDQDGWVESRPIKGTRRRGRTKEEDAELAAELAASEKDKAENMMIVDLVRNDLGRVCIKGSVSVPHFLTVETHAAVHHIVSVVRGKLKYDWKSTPPNRTECDAVDAVIAAFPGGSMTGAPKVSAMNIIDKYEAGPRGIYSGTIGFLSLNGAACLNIVIRTAVFDSSQVSVGSGGAIINLSNVDEEYEEMRLKAASVIRSFQGAQDFEVRGRRV